MLKISLVIFAIVLDRILSQNSNNDDDMSGGILNGWNKKLRIVDTEKDLVQPNEKHLDGIPKFIEQPKSIYYVSKSHPATVTCVAEPVSHVNMFCADKPYLYMNQELSATGLRVEKLDSSTGLPNKNGKRWRFSLNVRHKDVMEWFSEYRCYCEAWNQIEQLQQVKKVYSNSAIIYESYLNKDFKKSPDSQTLPTGDQLKLSCIPPDAKPPAEIYWLKNGIKIKDAPVRSDHLLGSLKQLPSDGVVNPVLPPTGVQAPKPASSASSSSSSEFSSNSNIQINDYRQLIINNLKLTDSGNYSCVAKSLALTRLSTARIVVLELGEWHDWGIWDAVCPADCYNKDICPTKCKTLSRKRIRHCKKVVGKLTKCRGLNTEQQRCDENCRTDLWTFWSQWSACSGSLCQKSRQRQCTVPERCAQPIAIQTLNCSKFLCSSNPSDSQSSFLEQNKNSEKSLKQFSAHDIAMYIGLFVVVSVFLIVVMVIFCLIRRRVISMSPNRAWRYSSTANGIPLFYDKDMKKENPIAKQINLFDIANHHANGTNISASSASQNQLVQPTSIYRSMVLPNSLPFLSTQQPTTSDDSSNAGYTDVSHLQQQPPHHYMQHITPLSIVNTPLIPSASATSAQHQQHIYFQQQQGTIPVPPPIPQSLMRPSYSDSRVSSVLHANGAQPPPPLPPCHPTLPSSHPQHHLYHRLDPNTAPTSYSQGVLHTNTIDPSTFNVKSNNNNNNSPSSRSSSLTSTSSSTSSMNPATTIDAIGNSSHHISSDHYQELSNITDSEAGLMTNSTLDDVHIDDIYEDDTLCWSTIGSEGGQITLSHSDTSLICPSNLFPLNKSERLFLLSSSKDPQLPSLTTNKTGEATLLSPVVVCGPASIVTSKPCILSIPHCVANVDSKDWIIVVFTSYSLLKQKPYWQKFVEFEPGEQSVSGPTGYAQLHQNRLLLLTTQLQRYCIVGYRNRNKRPIKVMRIVAYSNGLSQSNSNGSHDEQHSNGSGEDTVLVLRIYVVMDTADALNRLHKLETDRLGGRLLSNQTRMNLEYDTGNLIVAIGEVANDWQSCVTNKYQEMNFSNVWRNVSNHCSFTFVMRQPPSVSTANQPINHSNYQISISNGNPEPIQLPISSSPWFCNIHVYQQIQSTQSNAVQLLLTSSPSTSPNTSTLSTYNPTTNGFTYFVDDCPVAKTTIKHNSNQPTFKLPEVTKLKLCKLLDPPSPMDNDWRQFAQFLSVQRSLNFFNNKSSPTEILLDLWEAQNPNLTVRTLSNLMEMFHKIGRLDCVSVLESDLLANHNS